jgi:cell division protein FtsL
MTQSETDAQLLDAVRFLANIVVEVLRFLMAHPTHLTVAVCFIAACRTTVAVMAYTRTMVIEMKTLDEQREAREIDANRDVDIERARAHARLSEARIRVADSTIDLRSEDEAEAEEEAVLEAKHAVRARGSRRGR